MEVFQELYRPKAADSLIPLATDRPIWDRFIGVFPLVIVGSKEADGGYNLAPKHLAIPLGWENYFCFVCSPQHTTYHNIRRQGAFTVSYPRPTEVLPASLAAAPRCEDRSKPSLLVLPTFPARQVDGILVRGCYVVLECTLHSILDGFGPNSLVIGNVVAAVGVVRSGECLGEMSLLRAAAQLLKAAAHSSTAVARPVWKRPSWSTAPWSS